MKKLFFTGLTISAMLVLASTAIGKLEGKPTLTPPEPKCVTLYPLDNNCEDDDGPITMCVYGTDVRHIWFSGGFDYAKSPYEGTLVDTTSKGSLIKFNNGPAKCFATFSSELGIFTGRCITPDEICDFSYKER